MFCNGGYIEYKMNNMNCKIKTVMVTGASGGIGYELSKIFAGNGYDLVVVARSIEKLISLKNEILKDFNVHVVIIQMDLSISGSPNKLFNEIEKRNIEIDILVNNAGVGSCGLFNEINLEKNIEMIELNIKSLTILTKLFGDKMIERKWGKILNVASTGAYQPGPYIAVYYATKAYVLSFSQAINNEFNNKGVSVTTLCPGATRTGFSKYAGKLDLNIAMDAKVVAETAYKGLMKNKRLVIPGSKNKVAIILSKFLPGNISAYFVKKIQKKLTDKYKDS